MPRPGNLWVTAGSGAGLSQEAVEFRAGRVEGALLLVRAIVNQRAAVLMDPISEQTLNADFSQRRDLIEVPDDLSTEQPKVVHVSANGLAGKAR